MNSCWPSHEPESPLGATRHSPALNRRRPTQRSSASCPPRVSVPPAADLSTLTRALSQMTSRLWSCGSNFNVPYKSAESAVCAYLSPLSHSLCFPFLPAQFSNALSLPTVPLPGLTQPTMHLCTIQEIGRRHLAITIPKCSRLKSTRTRPVSSVRPPFQFPRHRAGKKILLPLLRPM